MKMTGNDDLKNFLQVALLLIENSPPETQEQQSIKTLKELIGPAIQWLGARPGPPVGVLAPARGER